MELFQLPVHQLVKNIKNKENSSQEIVQSFLNRINQVEPKIQAFNYLNENALDDAKKIDQQLAKGEELHQ
ncbi:MAG: Asp-tRNA(Asn)/Glu-tRNA(Gln) amidotransferase subunit GatA, partial [Candidatus Sericytochromatia bacterium]|nr:Asp-tRNA(Asn)/Glu-tRNA(Gln) amidotransferase subunit GatA [Candidatus Sericytochromatia bacterium]